MSCVNLTLCHRPGAFQAAPVRLDNSIDTILLTGGLTDEFIYECDLNNRQKKLSSGGM